MKIWAVKHKGKTWWGNFIGLTSEMHFNDKSVVNCGYFFFKRKDAMKYLKTLKYDFYEVVSAELEESKQDNRKSN